MITRTASLLFALGTFAATASAADTVAATDWVGKVIAIKPNKGGTSCIRIENFNALVGQPDKGTPDTGFFKVTLGSAPNSLVFESVAHPGLYLRHSSMHMVLLKGIDDTAVYRVEAPLRGNQGLSLQSVNFPGHYITLVDRERMDIVKDPKDARKAVFFFEERVK